ncbi:MAG: DM13 domain-containing protein [Chloroflexota bacterium]|nr:DM13 domain-containing protein [Chloroflexota bacterium]
MTFIGDLERLFATSLYPLRIPILIGLIALAVALAALAVRGRWDRVAARHRVATGIAIAVLIVVGLPAAWYLGSPLFLSSTLEEPAPVAVGATQAPSAPSSEAAPSGASSGSGQTASARPSSAATPAVIAPSASPAAPERSGSFKGADDFHFGRGTARIILAGDGSAVLRFERFAVRNGPDLFVYLSPKRTGYSAAAIELGRLKADTGSFNYKIPAGTDLARVKSVVIWCKQFAVQFAVAPLS